MWSLFYFSYPFTKRILLSAALNMLSARCDAGLNKDLPLNQLWKQVIFLRDFKKTTLFRLWALFLPEVPLTLPLQYSHRFLWNRLAGTNADVAKELLAHADVDLISADNFEDAALKVVEAAGL